ncbi:MAG TPA: bifunctional 5,10-methylenetetrahydrofolate dehydrogenase/5,10-methenyltetrahydrofolate cyclohydrolase [Thermoplasmata archaeon]|nr:bifunctional 5,10-methylenetetrahydrofolate dehydrogenase/5,10-methenyltetrahydrofolate cyclohydrolase [Thermoplasmata archaeon]
MTERLEGKPVAEEIAASVRRRLGSGAPGAAPPSLVSVHRGVDSPFRFYLARQAKVAAGMGVRFRDAALAPGDGPEALTARLRALDADPSVHAVLVEHPLPPPFDFLTALAALRPEKDVDGVGAASLGRLVGGRPVHVPAVARAAIAIARHYEVPLASERVVVIGRSETVGLPLALVLTGRDGGIGATVTVAHSRTRDLQSVLAGALTIFSCAGHPGLLDRSNVPEGAYVIDVGLSSLPDPDAPGGSRPAGDADAAALDGWAGGLTPVPGGVGPVTVAELMDGVVRARDLLASVGGLA